MTEDEREPYGIDFDATGPSVIETMEELRSELAKAQRLPNDFIDQTERRSQKERRGYPATNDARPPEAITFDAQNKSAEAILRTLVATARSLATTLYDAANALEVQRKAAKRPADDDVKP